MSAGKRRLGMTDDALTTEAERLYKRLKRSVVDEPGSKRHEKCFDEFYACSEEARKRGIKTIRVRW